VAVIQVRPAEALVKPGEAVQFAAMAFDREGRFLRPVEVEWSCKTPGGSIGKDGTFRAGKAGAIGEVAAKRQEAGGAARVRVVSELPIAEDFESCPEGDVIGWWIGASKTKYAVETVGGSKALKKIANDRGPIFNRSHAFITPPIQPGYTVQADVMAAKQGRRVGDVGLVNDRYVLEIIGNPPRLRIVSWVPAPRFEKRIDFRGEPGRWFTMKLRVDVEGGQAHVRGKVWPRGEAEPPAWTVEGIDPQPNLEGAAGLYANSTAPLYFDNVRVWRD
jgi:hypothetical protein